MTLAFEELKAGIIWRTTTRHDECNITAEAALLLHDGKVGVTSSSKRKRRLAAAVVTSGPVQPLLSL